MVWRLWWVGTWIRNFLFSDSEEFACKPEVVVPHSYVVARPGWNATLQVRVVLMITAERLTRTTVITKIWMVKTKLGGFVHALQTAIISFIHLPISERPLTPPPPLFLEKMLRFFSRNSFRRKKVCNKNFQIGNDPPSQSNAKKLQHFFI